MTNKYAKLGAQAKRSDNQAVSKSFERETPKEGTAFLRLIGYVELGRHLPNNTTYKPALKTILTFELSNPKHLIVNDKGEKIPQKFQLRLNKGATAKSGYKKVFNQMNKALGGGHEHFFEMFGKPLLGEIFHNVVNKDTPEEKTYANLDNDGAYSFKSPNVEDPITGEIVAVPIPEVHYEMQGFLWENESIDDADYKEMWDDLFIEGTSERDDPKNKGQKIEVSKNWLQELIMTNIEWADSRCEALTQDEIQLDSLEAGAIDLMSAAEDEPVSM